MKNKKNILICGGAGFLGRNILINLSKNKNYNIFATYHKTKKFNISNVKWIKANLTNAHQVKNLTAKKDIIIQAAATTSGANDIINKPFLHVTDNAIMNSYLLRSAYENNVGHFIFFSCTVMYHSSNKALKEVDYNPAKKIYPKYFGVANTKLYIEKMCEFYSSISSTKYTCIRHSNIYGPHDKYDLEKSHFFGASVSKVMNAKKEIQVWGDGKEKRDVLYIEDLVNFVKKCIKKQKNKFRIYNCGYGNAFFVKDIISKIIKISNKKLNMRFDSTKPSIKTFLYLDNSLAKRELKWKPKFTLNIGIKKTINWYKLNFK
jgi:nucleoside-diphosphate-sugar epimerase